MSKTAGVRYEFVNREDVPDDLEPNIVYVTPGALALKCPCGCVVPIFLNTVENASPRWKVIGNTITPSIMRLFGCKSHFSIKNGVSD